MKKPPPVDRYSPFWAQCFAIAYETLARREAAASKTLPGPKLAALARALADDCERARSVDLEAEACPSCNGPGCEACRFTGKADPGIGLHAPSGPVPTIRIGPPGPAPADAHRVIGAGPGPGSRERGCACADYPHAINPLCAIHGPPRMAHENDDFDLPEAPERGPA